MCISKLEILTLLCLVHTRIIFSSNIPTLHNPLDSIAISCGSSGRMAGRNGRAWFGDVGSISSSLLQMSGQSTRTRALHQPAKTDPVPFGSARASYHEFAFTFQVQPGQKFIRLHFFPASYKGFKKSTAIFSVKAGPYTLLANFSAELAVNSLGVQTLSKEFCINIPENQALHLVFSPSPISHDTYAFVNGIEIISMPAALYFTRDTDPGAQVVGQTYKFFIDNSTALEMVKRLNVGGNSISSVEDTSMFREWDDDFNNFLQTDADSIDRNIRIDYRDTPTYTAPMKVYQSARTASRESELDTHNLTWKISLDLGFRYLIRLHFCELDSGITTRSGREFTILVNSHIVEDSADIIKWAGGQGVAVYRDYVVIMEGNRMGNKRDLLITLKQKIGSTGDENHGILNGLEILKLSNPDNNLASMIPVNRAHSSTSSVPKHTLFLSLGGQNAIATILIVAITLLNTVVYYLRLLSEANSDEIRMKSTTVLHLCHQFSLDEIRSTTNNFHPEFFIGSGGYGKVYKGSINNGITIVAIKRLRPESGQGENEFWTEIKMLSKLRHEHLVSLIGYCNDSQEKLLVYEYMARGTLDDHLYKNQQKGKVSPPLSWEQRLKICIGAARGIYYLHQQRVIHRDVKSSNILLDGDWSAKISDFGLSKLGSPNESSSHVSTNVKGTFGYFDPEYFSTRRLTRKSDVFAFGVVLFEVLAGRPAVDMRLAEEQHSLAAWAQNCIRKGNIDQIIDPSLIGQISPTCLAVFVGIAQKCLNKSSQERAAMADVVTHLELALAFQQNPQSLKQAEEEAMKSGKTLSEQSDGIPKRAKMKKEEGLNSTARSRWGRGRLGFLPRTPSKKKASPPPPPQEGHYRQFSLDEIQKATNNFSTYLVIGYGASEIVYKGRIDGGQTMVSIRKSDSEESKFRMMQDVLLKIDNPSSLGHAHMVSLIGYYHDSQCTILVNKYMVYDSLYDCLHDSHKDPLPWRQRLEICIGAAHGLNYVQSMVKQTALHHVLRSIHILLPENWAAEYGLYKGTLVSNDWRFAKNLPLDSYYIRDGDELLREKSYVFSFGLILFEVLCATNESSRWLEEDQGSLARWITSSSRGDFLTKYIDPYIIGKISPECFRIYKDTASRCLLAQGNERPSMSDIVSNLEYAFKLQQAADAN